MKNIEQTTRENQFAPSYSFDSEAVRQQLKLFGFDNEETIFEIYVIPSDGGKLCGYFNNIDLAVEEIAQYNGKANIYITLNPVRPSQKTTPTNSLIRCFTRSADDDIKVDGWLFIDVDAKSVERTTNSKISSTDEELKTACETANQVYDYLRDEWDVPPSSMVTAISGNGAYVLVKLPAYAPTQEWKDRKAEILSHLSEKFTDKTLPNYGEVDTTVSNPARLIGVIGTIKIKGENTSARPHRLLRMVRGENQPFEAPYEPVEDAPSLTPFDLGEKLKGVDLSVKEDQKKARGRLNIEKYREKIKEVLAPYGYKENRTKKGLFAQARCPIHKGKGNTSLFVVIESDEYVPGAFGCRKPDCPTEDLLEWLKKRGIHSEIPAKKSPKVLKGFFASLNALFSACLPIAEEILFNVRRGQIAQVISTTNLGKTTLLLNAALKTAAGEAHQPLQTFDIPRRVLYLDFESRAQEFQQDLGTMLQGVTNPQLARENFASVVDAEIGDEPLTLSRREHLDHIIKKAKEHRADLVIVDTLASGFEMQDENSNAEAKKKVIKPLLRLAKEANCAVVFAHHFGKGNGTNSREAAYHGRGASNFGALSRTVFKLKRDQTKGDGYVILECVKAKGPRFEPVLLRLNFDSRWFELCLAKPQLPRELTAQEVAKFVYKQGFVKDDPTVRTKEILQEFEHLASERTIKARIDDAVELGLIEKKRKGRYVATTEFAESGGTIETVEGFHV